MSEGFIDSLELSVRTANVLRKHYPDMDMGRFMSLNWSELRHIPGLGRRSWNEIRELQGYFLHLQMQEKERRKTERHIKEQPDREVALTLLRSGDTSLYRKILPDHPELFVIIDGFNETTELLRDRIWDLERRLEEDL